MKLKLSKNAFLHTAEDNMAIASGNVDDDDEQKPVHRRTQEDRERDESMTSLSEAEHELNLKMSTPKMPKNSE